MVVFERWKSPRRCLRPLTGRALAVEPLERRDLLSAASLVGLDTFRADPRFTGIDGRGYSVAVIDTGATLDHPFLGPDLDANGVADRIVYQYDFADADADATDGSGTNHGSHVTSILASADALYGGVAPGTNLVILKVFSNGVRDADYGHVEQALAWVADHAAEYNIVAVNLSLGEGNYSAPETGFQIADELARLAERNIIVVAAAGNQYYNAGQQVAGVAYPAADPNVLAVSAVWADDFGPQSFEQGVDNTTAADRIAAWSQRHPELTDILAPGGLIPIENTGLLVQRRGTSVATPFVTGAAVLAQQLAERETGRRLTPAEFRELLQQTGRVVIDGDDENDNVANTGATFKRLDIFALGERLLADPGLPSLTIDDARVAEGNDGDRTLSITVRLSRPAAAPLSVQYATTDDSATVADEDFVALAGTLNFSPGGPQTRTIEVTIRGDRRAEATESFQIVLRNAVGAVIADAKSVVTLVDDDTLNPWQNPVDPFDANGDTRLSSNDALVIINRLNRTGPGILPLEPEPGVPHRYVDVNGDRRLTANDVLRVINEMNRRRTAPPQALEALPPDQISADSTASPAISLAVASQAVAPAPLPAAPPAPPPTAPSETAQTAWLAFWAQYGAATDAPIRRRSISTPCSLVG